MQRMVTIERVCPHCGKRKFIVVEEDKFNKWITGGLIQDVWPEKSPEEREEIKTGFCPECWKDLFGEEESDNV